MKVHELIDKEFSIQTEKIVSYSFWVDALQVVGNLLDDDKVLAYKKIRDIKNIVGSELLTNKGKIAKRIARQVKKDYGVKLPSGIISELGNMAYHDTRDSGNYTLIIDSNLKTNGKYGDDNSCFMYGGVNHHHLLSMIENGDFYALKIRENGNKIARCWVYIEDDNTMLFFNSYGMKMTDIVSLFVQIAPEFVNVHDRYSVDVWDNNDGRVMSKIHDHDESVYALCDILGDTCKYCDEHVDEDYIYYDDDGCVYCEDCYHENFFYCEECGCTHDIDYVEQVEIRKHSHGRSYHIYVCEECAKQSGYQKCEDCDGWSDDCHIHDDYPYCESCFYEFASYCEECGESVHNEDIKQIDVDHACGAYCNDCVHDLGIKKCKDCGEHCVDNDYCEDCELEHDRQLPLFPNIKGSTKQQKMPECPNCYLAADGGIVECGDCYTKRLQNEHIAESTSSKYWGKYDTRTYYEVHYG